MQICAMVPEGQSLHDAGRQLLETMYRSYTGSPMPQILVGERGKPYFATGNLHFSISHTKRRVFCALSQSPIGIDAEEMDREIDLRLADKIFSPGEKVRYEAAENKREALLRLWVLKEAQVKLTGEGLHGYPDKTDFSPDDPRVQIIDNCFVAIMEEQNAQA